MMTALIASLWAGSGAAAVIALCAGAEPRNAWLPIAAPFDPTSSAGRTSRTA